MTRLRSLWRLWRLRHVQREFETADAIRRWVEEDPTPVPADPPSESDTPSRP